MRYEAELAGEPAFLPLSLCRPQAPSRTFLEESVEEQQSPPS